jgi:DNA-binding response OmpR family regulator
VLKLVFKTESGGLLVSSSRRAHSETILKTQREADVTEKIKILLVEDDPEMERFIWAALTKHSWLEVNLECERRFSIALDRLKTESFDAILVDLSVSDLQGPGGPARVRTIALTLPVILLVDENETDPFQSSRELSLQRWLVKETLSQSRLIDMVKNVVNSKGFRERARQVGEPN